MTGPLILSALGALLTLLGVGAWWRATRTRVRLDARVEGLQAQAEAKAQETADRRVIAQETSAAVAAVHAREEERLRERAGPAGPDDVARIHAAAEALRKRRGGS